ncbi:MAG: histidine kinase N-terminal 7TM domain-containing protein [Lachnospiraceae bacterium]|nr:histidine kinase N-terminal 7TM domain-containing protein [Lachnospiraceae bacterium]
MMIHNIVLGIHIASLVVCFFIVYMLGRRENKHRANYMVVTIVCNVISLVGYILELMSTTEEAMITAVKMQYLGKSFVGTFLLYTFIRYYNWKFPRSIIRLFWVIDIGIYFVVLTLDYHMCYYKSYEVVTVAGKKFLVTEKAPLYIITMVYLLGILVLFSILCHKHWKTAEGRDKQVLGKLSVTSMVADMIIVLSIFDGAYPYDLVPMIITVFTVVIGFLIYKYGLFSTLDLAKDNLIVDIEEGVIVTDMEGNFQYANPKAYELIPQLRYADKKLIEKAIDRFVGNVKTDTIRFNGRFFKLNNRVLEDEKQTVGHMTTFFDITDLLESNKKMEQLKIEADNANYAKSNFLANMSHEIRTPINAVLGMDEMILRESSEENIIEYATSIKRAGESLLSLVSDILDFSKIESGKMTILDEPYNIKELIKDIINTFTLRMRQKGLSFITEIDENIPKILVGDEVRIKQIALNILSNAFKYTKEGYVKLKISSEIRGNKCVLSFSVEDTGSGIKKDAMEKLFATFERIDEKKNRHIEGSGLGLNITKNLLKMMGSDIQVKSVYGRGSIFFFDLEQRVSDYEPIGMMDIEDVKVDINQGSEDTFTAPHARMLVVDDNLVNLSVMKGLLKRTQATVEMASSGAEAVKMTKDREYDLIFMDHLMPEMDGIETMIRIKGMETNPNRNTPCIVLTANAISGAKEKYMEAGFDEYMTKPVNMDLLENNLRKFLS